MKRNLLAFLDVQNINVNQNHLHTKMSKLTIHFNDEMSY